jgi:hypothetical protein
VESKTQQPGNPRVLSRAMTDVLRELNDAQYKAVFDLIEWYGKPAPYKQRSFVERDDILDRLVAARVALKANIPRAFPDGSRAS